MSDLHAYLPAKVTTMMHVADSKEESTLISALLMTTASMGLLDAVCLLRYQTFTGYMTGTVILLGLHLTTGIGLAGPGLAALTSFLVGGIIGGRSVRRIHPTARLVGELLLAVALLVAIAAGLDAVTGGRSVLGTIALLGLAMGLQMSATRSAGVADMTMPAVTMILHGLAHDSRLARGDAIRSGRRAAVFASLFMGAIAGGVLSLVSSWLAFSVSAVLVGTAGTLLCIVSNQPRL